MCYSYIFIPTIIDTIREKNNLCFSMINYIRIFHKDINNACNLFFKKDLILKENEKNGKQTYK